MLRPYGRGTKNLSGLKTDVSFDAVYTGSVTPRKPHLTVVRAGARF